MEPISLKFINTNGKPVHVLTYKVSRSFEQHLQNSNIESKFQDQCTLESCKRHLSE
jgi:hypothetical protein